MNYLVYVMADIIHLVKVVILCNAFFTLPKREVKHRNLLIIFSCVVMVVTSTIIFFYNNYFVEIILYALIIIGIVFLLYKEKIYRIMVVAVGIIFALSMIDEMSIILVNILMELFDINGEKISIVLGSIVSLIFIYYVGRLYRRNNGTTMKSISMTNLIGFVILLAVNTFVVIAISIMITELDILRNNNIYLLAVVFVIIGIFIQLASVILLFTQRNVYKEKEELADKYLSEQKNHYEYLENREKETKKFRHDLKSHMEMISGLAKERQYERMNAYLDQMNVRIDDFGNVVTVQNGIVDAILNQYYARAQECGVCMKVKGRFPVDCNIEAFDLCTIFSNVLSNALEAAKETEEKYISVECVYTDLNIMIIVSNSYKPDASNAGLLRTKKPDLDYHGFGLENIKDSVKKYRGDLDIETNNNIFKLRILFQNMEKQIHENSSCR